MKYEFIDAYRSEFAVIRMCKALKVFESGYFMSRIRRLMKENGIYSITRYKHKPYPKEKVETRYNENIVDREFNITEPDRAWCGDITYIKTSTGWVYLAAVLDLFNREVVGYCVSKKANQCGKQHEQEGKSL